jgi:hypothetical protein
VKPLFRWFSPLLAVFLACSCWPDSANASPLPPAPNPATAQGQATSNSDSSAGVTLPGPLRSFLRMAGISQKVAPEEVLPFLARNVVVQGYHDPRDKNGKPNEFLVLLKRYMGHARALQRMAGPSGVLRVSSCAEAGPLLTVLGVRLREGCGPDAAIETVDVEEAFLTADSGFPLAQLEDDLRNNKPFEYRYESPVVPALFDASDWIRLDTEDKGKSPDLVDALINDAPLARLYWALYRMDSETREFLRRKPGLRDLQPLAPVLDFYGSQISIRSGKVVVPGGPSAESAWKDLVGANPSSPEEFVVKLLKKDEGWLAAYFDALSRVNREQQAFFTSPARLERDYNALRGRDLSPSPARFVFFRPDPDLLLLLTRLQVDSDGRPYVPGNLQAWKDILRRKDSPRLVRDWGRRAADWKDSSQLVEALIGLTRQRGDDGPTQIYLMLSAIDQGRPPALRLTPATVRLLADDFPRFWQQYLIFSEFPLLDNDSIARFLKVAGSLDSIRNDTLRANALGIFQANVGIWQILARQKQIPAERLNDSWQRMLNPFARKFSESSLFVAGHNALRETLRAAAGRADVSQAGIAELLAGPPQANANDEKVRADMARRILAIMSDQRLVSLDTLFSLSDALDSRAQAVPVDSAMLALAEELREFEMPQPLFTTRERAEWASGRYDVKHTQTQMRTDLRKVLTATPDSAQLDAARGELTSFLRDSLVGLNYAYYEPPGAQMLHINPMLVRSHDFAGDSTLRGEHWHTAYLFGRGGTASGGAHLVGSLANLPYVLADAEQDFIVPENVQALIWQDLVPTLLASSTVPRWWGVSRNELHAIRLYQMVGEELLGDSAKNEALRARVLDILSDRLSPPRALRLQQDLVAGRTKAAVLQVMPGETFYLGAEFRRRFPPETASTGPAGRELDALAASDPADVSWDRLSADFGVPHPKLADTYRRQLMDLKPFPAFMGYSSRLLAESWDSSNLYWARLADEMGYSPAMLNRIVPELTRRMVEKIFATHFEDLQAVARALRETGEDFREGKIAVMPSGTTSGN